MSLPERLEGTLDGIPVVIMRDEPCYTPELWYRDRKVYTLWVPIEQGRIRILWTFWGPNKEQARKVASRFGAEEWGGLCAILPDETLPVTLETPS